MFNHEIRNKGLNNNIDISSCPLKIKIIISGNNNNVRVLGNKKNNIITSFLPPPRQIFKKHNITIKIYGNNNTVYIDEIENCKKLTIDIGNYTGTDNVEVRIGKNFVCVDLCILAYQNKVPVTIGNNCLCSRNVIIRSGELPHKIYDIETEENLDNSQGVKIGDHVWLGENAYIMKKAEISNNSIVGSCSVVTKKFEEKNVVIAGNPARICKRNVNWNLA